MSAVGVVRTSKTGLQSKIGMAQMMSILFFSNEYMTSQRNVGNTLKIASPILILVGDMFT
jgi:hypothetical protein